MLQRGSMKCGGPEYATKNIDTLLDHFGGAVLFIWMLVTIETAHPHAATRKTVKRLDPELPSMSDGIDLSVHDARCAFVDGNS